MDLSDSARAKLDQANQMRSKLIQENSKVIYLCLLPLLTTRFITLSTFLNCNVSFQIKLSIENVKNKINDFKVTTFWDLC